MATAYLMLGSNIGDKSANLRKAIKNIGEKCTVNSLSSVYETEPWGFSHEESFYNQAASIETQYSPDELLQFLLNIEDEMGRERKGPEYQSRLIDLDILFYDKLIMDTRKLTIPHPRLHLRRFALIPMKEIAPEFIHPLIKKDISRLLEKCIDKLKVDKI
ncbi:MAG: 2-amino-4-hydroxy-6-hydroxymethyldihydropteridine diphosphokinase [Bacteroidales bacterium]|nr:2-amino-4-hydroxy-6-hydroxymethyldihydropteridine diphosphokinase [Bacteroidales bacterium]